MTPADPKGWRNAARRFWPLLLLLGLALAVLFSNAWMLHRKKQPPITAEQAGPSRNEPGAAPPPAVDLPEETALAGFLAAFGERIESLEEQADSAEERYRTSQALLAKQAETLSGLDRTLKELGNALAATESRAKEASERSTRAIDRVESAIEQAARPSLTGTGPLAWAGSTPTDDTSRSPKAPRLKRLQWGPVLPPEADPAPPEKPKRFLHLPAGAFADATLLSGVFAPVDQGAQPLPVLLRLNEPFRGPGGRLVPLQDAFLIGKAAGDANSQRAIIQLESLSVVLPSGEVFEAKVRGYVVAQDGQQGLSGRYEWNIQRILPAQFLSGGLAGAAEALAEGESSEVVTPAGGVVRAVTGNATRHAALRGLSSSFQKLGAIFEKRIGEIGPAIVVANGLPVSAVMLGGVTIEGYEVKTEGGAREKAYRTVD